MKNLFFLISVFFLIAISASAQKKGTGKPKYKKAGIAKEDSTIYKDTEVEKIPHFPGGDDSLVKYISMHVIYPQQALDYNIQGKVYVQIVVEKSGKVTNVTILKGLRGADIGCHNEAIRVIKSLPDFTPAQLHGRKVRCYFTIPIYFKIR